MNQTIDQERVARFFAEAHLRAGKGAGANGTLDLCVMQAVDWLAGGDGKTDAPECADPVIGRFCMRLNDASRWNGRSYCGGCARERMRRIYHANRDASLAHLDAMIRATETGS